MELFIALLALGALCCVLTILQPRVWWETFQSRYYRNPDAVEPSDHAFAVLRGTAVFILILCVGLIAAAAQEIQRVNEETKPALTAEQQGAAFGKAITSLAHKKGLAIRNLPAGAFTDPHPVPKGITANVTPHFAETGQVDLAVAGASAFGTAHVCITFPVEGEPTVSGLSCLPPEDLSRRWVENLGVEVLDVARADGSGPRRAELVVAAMKRLPDEARESFVIVTDDVARSGQVRAVFGDPAGHEGVVLEYGFVKQTWCLTLPPTTDGVATARKVFKGSVEGPQCGPPG